MDLIARELVPDLAQLDELTEDSILTVLKARYERDLIYTRVQDILISINPRKPLSIYGDQAYINYAWDNLDVKDPHVFEVAATAYRRLRELDTNQVIIVSGESGSGKTESTKYMVRHIVHMCQEGDMSLHEKIVRVNPLLESFGNAKTIMNGNSSRFAKYLEIGFTEEGQIAGATVRDYMLEKSRVVHQGNGEGTFHIFYALFAGCPRDKREDLFLNQMPGEYRIMKSDNESLDMDEQYREMYKYNMEVLQDIKVDPELLLAMLAGVINITEIEFQENARGVAEIVDAAPYAHAAILLDLDEQEFGHGLIASTKIFNGEEVVTYKSVKEAEDSRDALAKVLYERMFGWLVRQINQELHPNTRGSNLVSIGILDIAGFEKLQHNSFEQLLINLVNEKLQNFMNTLIFDIEMGIYRDEGIQLEGVQFKNNDDTLQLLEVAHGGILQVLDEVSNFKQGSDDAFVMDIKKKFSEHQRFHEPRGTLPNFSIQHFAALVTYDATGFIEKNRDQLNEELMECMKHSKDEFISDLFKVKKGPTGTISETKFNYRRSRRQQGVHLMPQGNVNLRPTPSGAQLAIELGKSLKTRFGEKLKQPNEAMRSVKPKNRQTLTSYFTRSLMDLLDKLKSANPFYVRCLKANSVQCAGMFDDTVVTDQLRYNGLAEVAKIRRMGFAVRKPHLDFLRRYNWMKKTRGGDNKSQISSILLSCLSEYHRDFRIGKSRVFMKEELDLFLEHLLKIRQVAASKTISKWFSQAIVDKRRREEEERKRREEEERRRREEERRQIEEERRRREEEEEKARLGRSIDYLRGSVKQSPPAAVDAPDGPDTTKATKAKNNLGASVKFETPGSSLSSSSRSEADEYQFKPGGPPRAPSPPTQIDPDRTPKTEEKQESDQTDGKTKEFEFWDVCQMVARERKMKDVYERRSLQVIKVITYGVLFCILLWCAVSQKISLMLLASSQYDRTLNRTESASEEDAVIAAGRHFLLTLAIVIPYCLILLSSTFKWLFGNLPFPQFSTLLLCFIIETLHTAGLCTLCFLVLPELDMARGIMLMSCVALAPALLGPVCTSRTKNNGGTGSVTHRLAVLAVDVLAILVMGAFIPVVLLTRPDHFLEESTVDNSTRDVVFFICSLIFISTQWWENFVDNRFCGPTRRTGSWNMFILGVKFDLQESRPVVSFFMSSWKICLTALLSWLYRSYLPINTHFEQRNIDEIGIGEVFQKLGDMPIKMNAAILTLTLASFVGNYFGSIAAKLQMQVFSLSLPLMLSVPLSVVVVFLDCSETFSLLNVFTDERSACMSADSYTGGGDFYWLHYVYGCAVWLALYWICRHIFFPTTERLAKIERMFMNPYYCGILFEQNFILGRKRHNRKVHKDFKDGKISYRLSDYDSRIDEDGEEEDNVNDITDDVNDDKYRSPKFRDIPMIYACATMWHENRQEMLQIMKSLFRMDRDQCLRRYAEELSGQKDDEFYDFEAHIMFDDAMELNDDEESEPNSFVKLMMSIIDEAASAVYEKRMRIKPPFKVPSPYGGQLIFTMPGNNFMFIHMKDKNKIRHRKRWSQVMYMYYLLGYRIVRLCQETVTQAIQNGQLSELLGWDERADMSVGNVGRSHIFHAFDDQVVKKASNTYLLALDGDVDFTPGAVRLLLDRMRKSEKVGAACGRIHPIGTGPVVWFQKFEYAIAHWLQKATEHVLGCVLCSPGCFSLFRGSALMDDNVMRKYTILPTEAAHHLMYDQGEDRWLCTLLLQQGYRVDYVAASDAFTYAPEGFAEFFNQRRRWMPSTVANIVDLLADYSNTVYINSNISFLYIIYQGALLVSTIVGPATVIMMIAGANLVVFQVNLINAYLIALLPACVFFVLCFFVETKWQILAAEILTGFYAFIMMIVFVGTVVTAAQESPFHPSVIFIGFLVLLFAAAAMLHPEEWTCVIFGVLYFLLIPTGFLLLIFYSLVNLHVVSWGTREVAKRKTPEEVEAEKKKAEAKKKKKEQGFFARFFPQAPLKDLKDLISKLTDIQGKQKEDESQETNKLLLKISDGIERLVEQKHGDAPKPKEVQINIDPTSLLATSQTLSTTADVQHKGILKKPGEAHRRGSVSISDSVTNIQDKTHELIYDKVKSVKRERDDMVNPAWADCKDLGKGPIINMVPEELKFWEGFLAKYLAPLTLTAEQKKNNTKALIELRNTVCLGMAMINFLWMAINFMFQLTSPTKIKLQLSTGGGGDTNDLEENLEENMDNTESETADNRVSVDALGMLFIFFFLAILLMQCFGMLIHRWGTFLHLVSVTQLHNPFAKFMKRGMQGNMDNKPFETKEAIKIMDKILNDPMPDYSDDEDESTISDQEEAKEELRNLQTKGTRFAGGPGNMLGTSRRIGTTTNMSGTRQAALSRSLKIMGDGLRATQSRFTSAPVLEQFQRKVQDQYRKQNDSKYKDRELPPIKRRSRYNLGAGRMELEEKFQLKERAMSDRESQPLIPEDDQDSVYDIIRPKGTIGRQLGKKLNVMFRTDVSDIARGGDDLDGTVYYGGRQGRHGPHQSRRRQNGGRADSSPYGGRTDTYGNYNDRPSRRLDDQVEMNMY